MAKKAKLKRWLERRLQHKGDTTSSSAVAAQQPARAAKPTASQQWLAWLLDDSIALPGGVRIGIDGLIGLVPVVGDVSMGAVSIYIILQAQRAGASKAVLLKMLANVGLESLVGMVPLLGDVFDFYFKANVRNLALLQEHQSRPQALARRSRWQVLLTSVGLLGVLCVLISVPMLMLIALVRLF